jgi:hypothetical protein
MGLGRIIFLAERIHIKMFLFFLPYIGHIGKGLAPEPHHFSVPELYQKR